PRPNCCNQRRRLPQRAGRGAGADQGEQVMNALRILRSPALVLLVAMTLAACTAMDKNVVRMDEQVTAITVGEAAAVPAYVLAAAMLQAGFTEDQILQRGVADQSLAGGPPDFSLLPSESRPCGPPRQPGGARGCHILATIVLKGRPDWVRLLPICGIPGSGV